LRWLLTCIRFLGSNPFVELAVGVTLVGAGVMELLGSHESAVGIQPAHGVIALGVSRLIVAAEQLFLGAELTANSIDELESTTRARIGWAARRLTEHPLFQSILAILLIVAGGVEAVEDFAADIPTVEDRLWHFGLIIFGVISLARVAVGVLKALMVLDHMDVSSAWIRRTIAGADGLLRRPGVEVIVAVGFIAFGLLEESDLLIHRAPSVGATTAATFVDVAATDDQSMAAHRGLIVFGVHYLLRMLPVFFTAAHIVEDAREQHLKRAA